MKYARICLSGCVAFLIVCVSMSSAVSEPLQQKVLDEKCVFSTILTVDDDGPADFSNISAALAASSNGDMIFVYPGIYEEHSLEVDKSVSLVGSGAQQTVVVGENRADVLLVSSDGVLISNLSVVDTFRGIVSENCSMLSVVGCSFVEVFDGVYFDRGSGGVVQECSFLNCSSGVFVGRSPNVTVKDSSFMGCSKGLYFEESDEGVLSDNVFEENEIGVYSSYAQRNVFSKNSFINNTRDVLAIVLFYKGRLWKNNFWQNNYWDTWIGVGVKVIWSALVVPINFVPIFLPWMQIDWNPAKQPY